MKYSYFERKTEKKRERERDGEIIYNFITAQLCWSFYWT